MKTAVGNGFVVKHFVNDIQSLHLPSQHSGKEPF